MGVGLAGQGDTQAEPRPRRWRRVILLVLGVLVALMLLAVAVVVIFRDQLAGAAGLAFRPDPQLEAAVEQAFEDAEGDDVVVLADVTDFEWDAVGVFHPYYPHESIVDQMGVPVPRGATNNLQNFESYCLLVFRDGDRVAGWTTVQRGVAECWPGEADGVYSPDEARFAADALTPVPSAVTRD